MKSLGNHFRLSLPVADVLNQQVHRDRRSAWLQLIGRPLGHMEGKHPPLFSAPDIAGRVPED
jgi:hypothetical protein